MKVKKKKSNEISVSEFKSWISGIEDMQEDDWVPNKAQWDKIKSKINLLAETIEMEQPEQWPNPPLPQPNPWQPGMYNQPIGPLAPPPNLQQPFVSNYSQPSSDFRPGDELTFADGSPVNSFI